MHHLRLLGCDLSTSSYVLERARFSDTRSILHAGLLV